MEKFQKLSRVEMKNVLGGLAGNCSVSCKDDNGKELGELDKLDNCTGTLKQCQAHWKDTTQTGCSCGGA